jgi:serine/threonine-protein phosphatase 2A activator
MQSTMVFQLPRKCILSPEQLTAFQSSKTHQEVVNYIETLNNAVVGVKLTDACPESPVI